VASGSYDFVSWWVVGILGIDVAVILFWIRRRRGRAENLTLANGERYGRNINGNKLDF